MANPITLKSMSEQIFITGATGCIGHYVLNELRVSFPGATLHLLVRRPERFKQDFLSWPNVVIHKAGMDDIETCKDILNRMDYVIHIATVWGYNLDHNLRINKTRTLEMLSYLDPQRIKKIIYFSTASILTQNNQLSDAAKVDGTPYVKSKYEGYLALKKCELNDKIITLFPTVVLGGSDQHPYSHISQGLLDIKRSIKWVKWLKVPGSFHFLHAEDIAKMVSISILNRDVPSDIVLGNGEVTFNDAFLEMATFCKQKPWVRFYIPRFVFWVLTVVLKKRIDSWGRHCLRNPYFNYLTHSPKSFNQSVSFPSFSDVLTRMTLNGE